MIKVTNLSTYDDFMNLMVSLRTIRRGIVENVKKGKILNDASLIDSFKNVETSLTKALKKVDLYQSEFCMDENQLFKFNIKDELLGVKKDLSYLDVYFHNENDESVFIDRLAQYHPDGPEKFKEESRDLTEKLKKYISDVKNDENEGNFNEKNGFFDYFFTDWDGTFKTYCSNYATCMQPAYSALILVKFLEHWCKLIAVLTAGPLRGPGILDLMALSPNDGVNVGGSWGREWLLAGSVDDNTAGRRLVDKSCFSPENEPLFEKLARGIQDLLKTEEFLSFSHVGSGFQRKVDRLTLAVQNVSDDVSNEMSQKYVAALEKLMHDIDPSGNFFLMEKSHLDVEIVIKQVNTSKQAWSKSSGLNLLQSHLNLKFDQKSRILLCGDTPSDLPMLEFFLSKNIYPFVVFVNPTKELKKNLEENVMKNHLNRLAIVGCPEALHAAMLALIKERRPQRNNL